MTHHASVVFRPAFCLQAYVSVLQVGHNNRRGCCLELAISFRFPVISLPQQNTDSATQNSLIIIFFSKELSLSYLALRLTVLLQSAKYLSTGEP